MNIFFKTVLLATVMTSSLTAAAVSPRELRRALQEKDFSKARQKVAVVLQNAKPTDKMPNHWTGTRGTVFESAPVGAYRVFASLPGGALPDAATLRTLLASDVDAKVQGSKTGNLLATYALPKGRGTVRVAMIRRDQTHLMADPNPKATDTRFLMTPVPAANRPADAYSPRVSEAVRKTLIEAMDAHDMPALMRRLERTQLEAYKALIPKIAGCQLWDLNKGLKKLGLPPLVEATIKAPRYKIVGSNGAAYTLRPMRGSDDAALQALENAHDAAGGGYVGTSHMPGEYRLSSYSTRYAAHFAPTAPQKYWVLKDSATQRIAGLFDYSGEVIALIHPDYRGQGLGQKIHSALQSYFQAHLGKPHVEAEPKPGVMDSPEVFQRLLATPNFKTFSRRIKHILDLQITPYAGFEAEVAYTNVPSMKIFSKGMSIQEFKNGYVRFAFPPKRESKTLRSLMTKMMAATRESKRAALRLKMAARETPPPAAPAAAA